MLIFKRLAVLTIALSATIAPAGAQCKSDSEDCGKPRFAWGTEFGGAIDMTGNDMSALTLNFSAGISCPYFEFIGAGVGAEIAVANSHRSYPFFAQIRTGFSRKPQLLFGDVKIGCSVNYLNGNERQTGLYLSLGPGIHLATGKKFSSYMQLTYSISPLHDAWDTSGSGEQATTIKVKYKTYQRIGVKLGVIF